MLAAAVAKDLDAAGLLSFDEDGVTGDAFVATMPASPDAAVALMPSGGQPTNSHDGYDEPSLQIIVRSAAHDPRPGYARARAIYSHLVGLHGVTLDEGGDDEVRVIRTVASQSDPFPLGADENGRHEWTLNFVFRVRALTSHRI
jgi:hypothetical protein